MSKKIIASLVVVCMVVLAGVFVTTYAVNASFPSGSSASSTLTGVVGKTWNTVSTVVQVIAVAAVVFAGVRYMYASAERRADIKKGLSYLAIGAVFVFAAATVARFIVRAGDHII
ncbi:MAG: hypothetical protein IKK84_02950 [Clostridia bacterium]|nr:hypothetical protein [Clostridia bacterium]MBR6641336.1 hypothetical protein [Clostridia bacterium]